VSVISLAVSSIKNDTLASISKKYSFIIKNNNFIVHISIFIYRKMTLQTLQSPAATQDLDITVDVCIKTQHIHPPLWLAWVPVHGEAQ
jgi:hypothetical protein